MAVDEAIIGKIQKLLALAGNNDNEHQAAAAAAKAQALMQEFDLSQADISVKVDKRTAGVGKGESTTLRQAGKPGGWKVALFRAVGETSDCWVRYSEGSKWYDATGYLIGRTRDVEMAHYVFEFLARELTHLQDVYGKSQWAALKEYAKREHMSTHDAERDFSAMGEHPLRMKDSWIKGAVEQVASNLYLAKRERDNTPGADALVINKGAEINDWWARERGYADYADFKAKTAIVRTDSKPIKPMTAKERAHYEAMARRAQRSADAAARRRAANLNVTAYYEGARTGRTIGVRPGVNPGSPTEARRGLGEG